MDKIKNLFSTPMKAVVSVLCLAVILLMLGMGIAQKDTPSKSGGQISLDDAKDAALSDAGLSSSDVTYTKEKSDYEDGTAVFDIEFYTSTHKYEYEINAVTGAVYSKDVESFSSGAGQAKNNSSVDASVSMEDAKNIAVTHAGFSVDDVTFSKEKQDMEDGQLAYEIEFYKDGREYEYTINAATGDIMEYDID